MLRVKAKERERERAEVYLCVYIGTHVSCILFHVWTFIIKHVCVQQTLYTQAGVRYIAIFTENLPTMSF